MAKTAAERAQATLTKLDEKIDAIEGRKAAAVAKVEARYEDQLKQLEIERDYAEQHPALQAANTTA